MLQKISIIARDAGKRILSVYEKLDAHSVISKEDGSPLTIADQIAHDFIISALQKLYPSIPIVSEEGATAPWEDHLTWEEYFLVDPLDGTKEFISRNGDFTVNIALIRDCRPVLGVVHIPVHGMTYSAMQGEGAWRESGDQARVRLQVKHWDDSRLTKVVGSRSHASPEIKIFNQCFSSCEIISRGSALKLCMVAEGSADFYPRHGPTSIWDIAAGHCLVKEAGGVVVDRLGNDLTYGVGSSFLNPPFLAATRLSSEVLECFGRSVA